MQELIVSGRIVDLIIGLMVLEGIALGAYFAGTGRGVPPLELVVNLAAGAALLVALRLALTGARWPAIAGALAVAGVLHLADLARRWLRVRGARGR